MTPELRAALRSIDKQFDVVRAMPEPIASADRYRHGIENIGSGGYLCLKGQVYRVEELSHYREKKSRWYELEIFSVHSGETRFLEWERDDEVEVAFNDPPVSLRQLGKTSDEIEAMSEAEKGQIDFAGRSYHYDDDYGATYHRAGGEQGEKVYFYDFETSDERYCLTIEEWGDESEGYSYDVYPSEYIEPDEIEVLVVGQGAPG